MKYYADFHVHSEASNDGISSLEKLTAAAAAAGMHALAVTDHNLCTPVPQQMNGVLLIPGCEVSTAGGHILGLFLDQPLDMERLCAGGLPAADAAVEEIHRCGGIAVLAHPYERVHAEEAMFPSHPDGIETANARACYKVPDANQKAENYAELQKLPKTGGSDAHRADEISHAYTCLDCDELTAAALKQALKDGQCSPVFVRHTSYLAKGRSQWVKAKRSGSMKRKLVGLAYLGYCILLDLFHPMNVRQKAQ